MRTSWGPAQHRLRRGTGAAVRQGGAIMMFVLLAALMIAMITLSVMRLVAGDITEGFGGLEAVQAFNVAEAGAHYAMGKLGAAGSGTYAGETITVMNGATTLGSATITVNCIDAGNPAGALVPPCSTSTYPGYRRVISTSTLPMSGPSGGPTRTIVAIVQSTSGSAPSAVCGTGIAGNPGATVSLAEQTQVYGNVGANGAISVTTNGAGYGIVADTNTPPAYSGKAVSSSTITCSVSCATQVQGGIFPSTSPAPCAKPTLPTFASGGSAFSVPCTGATINSPTGFKYSSISFQSVASPGAPTVAPVGLTGTTTYSYQIVAKDACGKQSPGSPSTQITNGYAPLSSTNYNHITWTVVPGASSYDVLKNNNLLGNTSAATLNDTGQSTTSYKNCSSFTDLTIQTDPSNPSATTVGNITTGGLTMGYCSRLIIGGVGKLELDFGQSTGQAVRVCGSCHFGVLSTDTQSIPAPIPANRFTVNVNSSDWSDPNYAVYFSGDNAIIAGTFNVPNGGLWQKHDTFYGSISAGLIALEDATVYSDTSGSSGSTYTNFTNLKSWKDQ